MKKLVLFLATAVLALTFAINASADEGKKRPPIEDVIINYGQGHKGGPRRSVEVSEVNAQTTNVTCTEIGEAYVVVLDKSNNVVDSAFIDASEEVSVVISNPTEGEKYTVVVLSATSYDEINVD